MPAKDIFHNIVTSALKKDGWIITNDPLFLSVGGVDFYIDIGAEKLVAAEKNGQKIAVEIKSFISGSEIYEFHSALGQFINYRFALAQKEPDRILYLAISLDIFDTFFQRQFIQSILESCQLKLIIYEPNHEVIKLWID